MNNNPTTRNPLISIIVPIYNSADSLDNCLKSISQQSYKNIEIIMIDDGSTDDSPALEKYFSNCEPRAKLFTQKNSGVACARNLGLQNSTGEYVIHCDSDDILPNNAIELLCETALKNQADISIGEYIVRYPGKDTLVTNRNHGSHKELLDGILDDSIHSGLWNKLIKRSLYDGISFEPGINLMEDKLILAKILIKNSPIISYIDKPVYIYRQTTNSISRVISDKSITDSIKVTNILCSLLNGLYPAASLINIKHKNRIFVLRNSNNPEQLKSTEEDLNILKNSKIPIKSRVLLWLLLRNVTLPIKIYDYFRSLKKKHLEFT